MYCTVNEITVGCAVYVPLCPRGNKKEFNFGVLSSCNMNFFYCTDKLDYLYLFKGIQIEKFHFKGTVEQRLGYQTCRFPFKVILLRNSFKWRVS